MKHLPRVLSRLLLLSLAASLIGCATLQPGADALIVRTEQTQTAALAAFDAFLQWDYSNRANAAVPVAVHNYADFIRDHGLQALSQLENAKTTYKNAAAGQKNSAVVEALRQNVNDLAVRCSSYINAK